MSQNDLVLADQTFPEMLADLNSAFQALASNSAGATAPTTTYPFQVWADETNNALKMRNKANNAWLTLAMINPTTDRWEVRADVIQALTASGFSLKNAAGTQILGINNAGTLSLAPNSIAGSAVATFTDLAKGAVPASGGGTTKFLRADGTWGTIAAVPTLTKAQAEAATGPNSLVEGPVTGSLLAGAIATHAPTGAVTDVTATRTHSTAYQNTGARAFLLILATSGGGAVYFQTSPDNVTWTNITWATGGGAFHSTTCAIPPTGYWRINGAATINSAQQVAL